MMLQFPLFEPPSDWQLPDLIDLSYSKYIGFDVETNDPNLKKRGPGAVRGDGHLAGISLAADDGYTCYLPIGHDVAPNMNKERVLSYLRDQLGREYQTKVGANVLYDLEWLAVNDVFVKGPLYDIQVAEPLIDENQMDYSLERLSQKYLEVGKAERKLKEAVVTFCGEKADVKANLWRIPAKFVAEYAEADANHPLNIMLKQLVEVEKQGLERVLDLEHRLIPLLLQMRLMGVRVDVDRAEKVSASLDQQQVEAQKALDRFVGAKEINVWSAHHLQRAFDDCGYRYPYTEKGAPSFTQDWLEDQEHDLAKHIVAVRRLDRSRKTYIDYVILENEINGRVYTQFLPLRRNDGGTVTGRLSSRTPNLQQVPARDPVLAPLVRSCFIPEEGCYWECDDFCLTGDTLIITDNGEVPISEVFVGARVLSSADGEELSMQLVSASQRVGRNVPVYCLTLADGSSVRCTATHKWMLYDGQMIETQELTGGEHLAHVKSGKAGPAGYPTWYLKSAFNYKYKHKLCIDGDRPVNCHIDHIDGDIKNWKRTNLRWLPAAENYAQGGQRYWRAVKNGERSDERRLTALREGLKRRRSYEGKENPNYGKRNGGMRACNYCTNEKYVEPRILRQPVFYCSRKCYDESRRKNNHRVVSVEYVGREDIYQITVENTHTYVLANGLISGNSQIEPRVAVHFAYKSSTQGAEAARSAYLNDVSTDFHQLTADLTGLDRKPAKTINLALMYGMGLSKLANDLAVVMEEAKRIKDQYGQKMPFIERHSRKVNQFAEAHGYIRTLAGRKRHFDLYVPKDFMQGRRPLPLEEAKKVYEPPLQRFKAHTAYNGLVQGSAADVMKTAMLLLWDSGIYNEIPIMHLTVHDETDHSIPHDKKEISREIKYIMTERVQDELELFVPLKVDQEIGPNWGEVEEQ